MSYSGWGLNMHKKKERKKSQDFRVICVNSKSSLKLWMPSQSQVESFIGISQVSLKSSNLRLESNSSQVMWLESPTSGYEWREEDKKKRWRSATRRVLAQTPKFHLFLQTSLVPVQNVPVWFLGLWFCCLMNRSSKLLHTPHWLKGSSKD